MIKVPVRAKISQDFKDTLRSIAQKRLEKLHANYEQMNPKQKTYFMTKTGIQIATLKGLVSDAGKRDLNLARFRMLPYDEFGIEEYAGTLYLKGVTKSIIVTEDKQDLGPYMVFVNAEDYVAGDTKDIHFVPMLDPLSGLRFWHHYALGPRLPMIDRGGYGFNVSGKSLTLDHYLNAQSFTCWGSFGSVATMQFDEMNTPELFRTFSIYLSRHNPNSHLTPREYQERGQRITLRFARDL